jgi:hypothetical protein
MREIDNVLIVCEDIVRIESLKGHCQLSGNLRGYVDFILIFYLQVLLMQ